VCGAGVYTTQQQKKKLHEKNKKNTRIFFSPNKKKSFQKIKNVQNLLKKKCLEQLKGLLFFRMI
jgi:hypothetical protein